MRENYYVMIVCLILGIFLLIGGIFVKGELAIMGIFTLIPSVVMMIAIKDEIKESRKNETPKQIRFRKLKKLKRKSFLTIKL